MTTVNLLNIISVILEYTVFLILAFYILLILFQKRRNIELFCILFGINYIASGLFDSVKDWLFVNFYSDVISISEHRFVELGLSIFRVIWGLLLIVVSDKFESLVESFFENKE